MYACCTVIYSKLTTTPPMNPLSICQKCGALRQGIFALTKLLLSLCFKKQRERARKKKMEREIEMKLSKFKRICVFCGSSPGKKNSYKEAAIELGKELVMSLFFFFLLYFLKLCNLPSFFKSLVYSLI